MKGHIQPYLDAIVSLYNIKGSSKYLTIPNVVRVQTGENVNISLSDEVEIVDEKGNKIDAGDKVDEGDCMSDDEFEELIEGGPAQERSLDYLEEGARVACAIRDKKKGWVLGQKDMLARGKVVAHLGDGKIAVKFVNGKTYGLPIHQMRKARFVYYGVFIASKWPLLIASCPTTERILNPNSRS